MTKIYIYTLSCPDTGQVMYVGKTNNVKSRYHQHLRTAYFGDMNMNSHWIASVMIAGKLPQLSIVDSCDKSDEVLTELKWISHFASMNAEIKNFSGNPDKFKKKKSHDVMVYELRYKRLNREPIRRKELSQMIKSLPDNLFTVTDTKGDG